MLNCACVVHRLLQRETIITQTIIIAACHVADFCEEENAYGVFAPSIV